jgi:hypothetical protein
MPWSKDKTYGDVSPEIQETPSALLDYRVFDVDASPELDVPGYTEDRDVSRMRELVDPERWASLGKMPPNLTERFIRLWALCHAFDLDVGEEYVRMNYLATRSEEAFGSEQMVRIARPAPPTTPTQPRRAGLFRWGPPQREGSP